MLEIENRRRHFLCHTHKELFLRKPCLNENRLLFTVIVGRDFKVGNGNKGNGACINHSRYKLTHRFRLLCLLPVLCRCFGNVIDHLCVVA